MARAGTRSISVLSVPHSRKIMKLMGTTGLFISGSYFVWQSYSLNRTKVGLPGVANVAQAQSCVLIENDYVELPHHKGVISLPVDTIEAKSELKSMIPRHLRKPWKLLHQANEGGYEQHLSAVRDLAKLGKYLSDGEIRQLAQSSSMRTTIGLARIRNVDLRFFLKPPPLPQWINDSSVQNLFQQLLRSMPKESVHNCIRFFTTTALENYVPGSDEDLINDIDIGLEFQRDSHHIHSIPRRRYSAETIVIYCLQAMLSHSTIESHCKKMIELSCLPIFQKIVKEFPNSMIKSLIGKIIANLSLFQETHHSIFQSGWVGLLAQWKQSPNLLITLPATKALCNLDQAFGFTFHPGIYLLLPNDRNVQHINELSNLGIDVVFVHGLLGGVFYSWRQADPHNERQWGSTELSSLDDYSYCWPRDWVGSEPAINDRVRVIGVDFDTYLSQWGNTCPTESFKTSLSERSEDIFQKLKKSGVGRRPVIFVGHSMGGLIIKEMLSKASESGSDSDMEFVKNTRGVIFYSTPHAGSHVAKLSATSKFLFFPSTEVKDLEANSPKLCNLNQSFMHLVKEQNLRVISFGETAATPYMGMDFTFVPPRSSNPGYGEFYPVKNVNHMNICKPDSKSSILYRKLMNLVWDALDEVSPFASS